MPQWSPFADLTFRPPSPSAVLLGALLAVGLCSVCSVPVQAQRPLTAPTVQADARFGTAVVTAGDLNADDVPDVAVGAPREAVGEKNETGRVHLFGGSDGEHLQSLAPPEPRMGNARFGTALAPLANLGSADSPGLVVGAPRDAVPRTGNRPGKAYVFTGSTAALRFALVSPQPTADGRFGQAVAAPGDLTGDGIGEIVVGAPGESNSDSETGRVYVFDGTDGSPVRDLDPPDSDAGSFGKAVAGVGDVDEDGVPDLLIGAPRSPVQGNPNAGRAYLFSGASGDRLFSFSHPDPDWSEKYGAFGASVASGGDLTGDGVPDLLVGASRGGGRVFVYSGTNGELFSELEPEDALSSSGRFGAAAAAVGVEREQAPPRVVVGAPDERSGRTLGRVYIFQGQRDLRDPNDAEPIHLEQPRTRSRFGADLAAIGDLDGDERSDLAVGAPRGDVTPTGDSTYGWAGKVHLYRSTSDTLRRPEVFDGPFQAPEAPAGFSTHVADWSDLRFGLVYPEEWEAVDLGRKGLPVLELSRRKGTAKKRWSGSFGGTSGGDPNPLRLFGADNASIIVAGKGLLGGGKAAFKESPAPRELINPSRETARVREATVVQPLRDTTIGGFDAAVFGVQGKSREGYEMTYGITVLDTPGKMVGIKVMSPPGEDVLSDDALRTMFERLGVGPPSPGE